MLHEPGHQSKRTISSQANAPQAALAPVQGSVAPAELQPPLGYIQAPPVPQYAPQVMVISRPGCVTLTALTFFVLTVTSFFGGLGSLLLADIVGFIGGIGSSIVFVIVGLGLWVMYRWSANLVLLFVVTSIAQFGLSIIYSGMVIGDYLQNETAQVMAMLIYATIYIFFMLILVGVGWWFARTRRWFLPNTMFPKSEKWLYWFAAVVLVLRVISSVNAVPDQFEIQRAQFERVDRDFENLYRTPVPPTDDSPFG